MPLFAQTGCTLAQKDWKWRCVGESSLSDESPSNRGRETVLFSGVKNFFKKFLESCCCCSSKKIVIRISFLLNLKKKKWHSKMAFLKTPWQGLHDSALLFKGRKHCPRACRHACKKGTSSFDYSHGVMRGYGPVEMVLHSGTQGHPAISNTIGVTSRAAGHMGPRAHSRHLQICAGPRFWAGELNDFFISSATWVT